MKKGYLKLLLIMLSMAIVIILNIFVFKISNIYLFALFWLFALIITILLLGFEKNKSIYKIDIIQKVLIYCVGYIILYYVSGIVVGYLTSGYNMSLKAIFNNTFPIVLLIACQELFRYAASTKAKGNGFLMALIIGVFILFDIAIYYRGYGVGTNLGILKFVTLLVFPSIAKNVFLTYLTAKNGYEAPLIYRIILEISIYIIPIVPNLGDYIEAVVKFMFPMLLFLKFYSLLSKEKMVKLEKKSLKIVLWVSTIALCILVLLTTGLFKYSALAVGSGSMEPKISVGDVIIYQKVKAPNYNKLKVGDILVHKVNNIIVVHRIISIEKDENDNYAIRTKGDANESPDGYTITNNQIIGTVMFKISYIGLPTVWLSHIIS